jgi:hypothetical protein
MIELMNMLEVIVKGANTAAGQTSIAPPGRSPELAALVTPSDHFVRLRRTAPCPFCGADPPLAAQIAGRFHVGCDRDDCHVNPQVSGQSLSDAWARWNKRQA